MTRSNATLADIARLAGVSKMTVSKVLNHQPGVSKETSRHVLEIARQLNYTPHTAAKKLAGGKTNIIGIVVPALDSTFMSEVVRGAGEALEGAGKDLLLFTDHRNGQEDRMYLLARGLVDGLLVALPRSLEPYEHGQLPVVVIEPLTAASTLPAISAENYLSSRKAIEHLLLLGHRRIGFIGGNPALRSSQLRLQGYLDALSAAGIASDPELIRPGDFSQRRGFAAAEELLDLPEPPSAIFAANDVSAFGAYDAIKHRGLRIPEDLSVVGFDDIFQAAQVFPPLTTVHQPTFEMGATGTRLLLSMIQGLEPAVWQLELPTELVIRDSTAPYRGQKHE